MLLPERDIFKGCAKETVRQLRGCRHNKGDGIGQGLCGLAAVVFQKHDELMLTRHSIAFSLDALVEMAHAGMRYSEPI